MAKGLKITSNGISNENIAIYYDVKKKQISGMDKAYTIGKKTFANVYSKGPFSKAVKSLKKNLTETSTAKDVIAIVEACGIEMDTYYRYYA